MVSASNRVTVACLDCERPIELTFQPVEGQIITCPHCDAELEVINTRPLELDFYYEDQDDDDGEDEEWDEDEDEDWHDDEDED